jgi:hypothetical protein
MRANGTNGSYHNAACRNPSFGFRPYPLSSTTSLASTRMSFPDVSRPFVNPPETAASSQTQSFARLPSFTNERLLSVIWPIRSIGIIWSDCKKSRHRRWGVVSALTKRDCIDASGRTIRSRGTGLGKQVPIEEGGARFVDYARTGKIDSWAGPVAGAGDIERWLAFPRFTLNTGQQRGALLACFAVNESSKSPLGAVYRGPAARWPCRRSAPCPRSARGVAFDKRRLVRWS